MERKGDKSRRKGSNAASSESIGIWVVAIWAQILVWVDDYGEEETGVGQQEEGCSE